MNNEYDNTKELIGNALTTSRLRHINKKFEDNNVLNNDELDLLIAQYEDGIRALAPLGAVFQLARTELIRRLGTCEAWKQARKEQAERAEYFEKMRQSLES